MEISAQLLKPSIEKIETEWQNFYREINGVESEEAIAIRPSVEQRIRQLEKFRTSVMYFERDTSAFKEFPNLHEALRFLKLDLRTTRRKWRRHLVSQIRTQKRQERAAHASPQVA